MRLGAKAIYWIHLPEAKQERNEYECGLLLDVLYRLMSSTDHDCKLQRVHLCIQGYTYVYRGTPMYTGVHLCILGYTYVYRGTPMYTGVHLCIQGYTYVYRGTPMYTGVHRCIQGYTYVYRRTEHFRAHDWMV